MNVKRVLVTCGAALVISAGAIGAAPSPASAWMADCYGAMNLSDESYLAYCGSGNQRVRAIAQCNGWTTNGTYTTYSRAGSWVGPGAYSEADCTSILYLGEQIYSGGYEFD